MFNQSVCHMLSPWGCSAWAQVFQPVPAQLDDMAAFHNREYLEYLTVADRGKVWLGMEGG